MSDVTQGVESQPGIVRATDGTITDPAVTPDPSTPTTTPAPTTETKPDGKTLLTEGKPADKPEPKPAEGAPEKYEDYKVPDGYTLDPTVKGEADKLFKGLGLNQDQAQSLVDFYTKQTTEAFQAPFEAYQKMTSDWRSQAESHPALRGKLGPGQEVNVRIGRALDSLGDPKLSADFRELMDLTGAGNHQAFIRVIDAFAKRVIEGTHVAGNGPSRAGQSAPGGTPQSAAQAMYPHLPSANRGT
jgi:hypothetical protein